jgi:hypothetical protein
MACRARREWEQKHPGKCYEDWFLRTASARAPIERPTPTTKTCTDCGQTMPLDGFVRIRSAKTGHYLRCREWRARRARERYQPDPVERERQNARVRRDRAKRRAATLGAVG